MKVNRALLTLFLTAALLLVSVSTALAVPPMPSSFWGRIKINGANAPSGTKISGWIDGVKYAETTVLLYEGDTVYSLDVAGDDDWSAGAVEGGAPGDVVVFYIGDVPADQTAVWASGKNVELNLTASVAPNVWPAITETEPVAVSMSEDGSPTPFSLALNATDANGDSLTWSIAAPAAHGTASAAGTGLTKTIGYLPAANFNGSDSFVVQVADGRGGTDAITVNITVTAVNDAPAATAQSVAVLEDTPTAITLTGTDLDGDELAYILVSGPAHGALSGDPPALTYTPAADYNGSDSLTFKVNDKGLDSSPATVNLTVAPVNDSPIAVDDAYATEQDAPLVVPAPGVLANDTDVEGDPLSAALVEGPSSGNLTFNPDGSFTYTPEAGFTGTVTFTYQVNEPQGTGETAQVKIVVTGIPVSGPTQLYIPLIMDRH